MLKAHLDHPASLQTQTIPNRIEPIMKNTGKDYESRVKSIYEALTEDDRFTSVESNVELPGPDGPRQIDVLLRSSVAHFDLITIIECRDYEKRLDLAHIDGFHSKMLDVKASKCIIVSRVGFSKSATNKAERLGITLCVASTATDILSRIGIQIPIEVIELHNSRFSGKGVISVHTESTFTLQESLTVNGVYLPELLRSEIIEGITPVPQESTSIDWSPRSMSPPYTIRNSSGVTFSLDGVTCNADFEVRRFFGYIDEVPEILCHQEIQSNLIRIILRAEEFPRIIERLTAFKPTEKHVNPTLQVLLMVLPVVDMTSSRVSAVRISDLPGGTERE